MARRNALRIPDACSQLLGGGDPKTAFDADACSTI